MDVSLLVSADYASVSKDNKLNIMGIFSRLYMSQFPGKHPQMFLVVQLRATPAEYGRKFKLGIRLIDMDAIRHLVNVNANLQIPSLKNVNRAEINHVVRLNNIEFPEPGLYDFSILIDNDVKASLPLEVLEMPRRAVPPSQANQDGQADEDDSF